MTDEAKIEKAIRLLLEGLGEDTEREGLKDTPARVARMYAETMAGMEEDAATHLGRTFSAGSGDMVLERDITFFSTCEHHLMPFFGKVHVAYLPNGRVVGLSKLARTVEVFAKRLQMQERMTEQIADALMEHLSCRGVMVLVEAEHTCMTMRGVKKPGSSTVTVAERGAFAEDAALREQFYHMLGR
ncbi:MAG: GTP cyclohydrolase I FolE [Lachnospiraceae bacterium]|nr:GTP cyclohydrolase I FolE [Lachnospiraceae bacterium]